ncbi:hypothetical protein GCM10027594_09600 [Hymenobacter agri]
MAKTYQSANDVVQIKDKEQGKLLAKGGILFFNDNKVPVGFVVHTQTIYLKDGRYKYLPHDRLQAPEHRGHRLWPARWLDGPAGAGHASCRFPRQAVV